MTRQSPIREATAAEHTQYQTSHNPKWLKPNPPLEMSDHEEHHELLKSQDMYEKLAGGRTVEEVCNICTPIRKHYEEES